MKYQNISSAFKSRTGAVGTVAVLVGMAIMGLGLLAGSWLQNPDNRINILPRAAIEDFPVQASWVDQGTLATTDDRIDFIVTSLPCSDSGWDSVRVYDSRNNNKEIGLMKNYSMPVPTTGGLGKYFYGKWPDNNAVEKCYYRFYGTKEQLRVTKGLPKFVKLALPGQTQHSNEIDLGDHAAIPNCQNLQGPTSLSVGQAGEFTAAFKSEQGQLTGELFVNNFETTIVRKTLSTSTQPINSILSGRWTPTKAGTFTIYCRAWNDGIAECRPPNLVDGVPRHQCSGPTYQMTVNVTQALPDVQISDLQMVTTPAISGQRNSFRFTVLNSGNGPTSSTFKVAFFANDTRIGDMSLSGVSPNVPFSSTYGFTLPATAGTYTFKATADSANNFTESNENNNSKTITQIVSPVTPTLIPPTLTCTSIPGAANGGVKFDWNKVTGANNYNLDVVWTNTGGDYQQGVFSADVGDVATKTITSTNYGANFQARVKSKNGSNLSLVSNTVNCAVVQPVGSIKVTIPNAPNGAQWRRVNTANNLPWRNTGTTEPRVPGVNAAGTVVNHTIEFNDIANFTKPANITGVTVTHGQTTERTSAAYTQQTVCVPRLVSPANNASVTSNPTFEWTACTGSNLKYRIEVTGNATPSTVNFVGNRYAFTSPVPTWISGKVYSWKVKLCPNADCIGGTFSSEYKFTYNTPITTGSLMVTIPGSVPEGGQWRRITSLNNLPWRKSGTTEPGITVAVNVGVEFKDVQGYTKPQAINGIHINPGVVSNHTATSGYSQLQQIGSLRVNIGGSVPPGAQWKIVGTTTWRNSGTTDPRIAVGTAYVVEFKDVAGFTKPANITSIAITSGQITVKTSTAYAPTVIACLKKAQGDADCNDKIDYVDFVCWRGEKNSSKPTNCTSADFTGPNNVPDGVVNGQDYSLWRNKMLQQLNLPQG